MDFQTSIISAAYLRKRPDSLPRNTSSRIKFIKFDFWEDKPWYIIYCKLYSKEAFELYLYVMTAEQLPFWIISAFFIQRLLGLSFIPIGVLESVKLICLLLYLYIFITPIKQKCKVFCCFQHFPLHLLYHKLFKCKDFVLFCQKPCTFKSAVVPRQLIWNSN